MSIPLQGLTVLILSFMAGARVGPPSARQSNTSYVMVESGVRIEVKDWGGSGRPVMLIAGLGATLEAFNKFAPMLIGRYHVYGVTRRGYGSSSHPAAVGTNYDADRLGDDVLSVLNQMKIERPILIGHSFGGEELSSVCSRFPDRVAGLIYLDAGYRYAFSPERRGDFHIDTLELRRELNTSLDAISPAEQKSAIARLQETIPQFAADLEEQKKISATAPHMPEKEYAKEKLDTATPEGQIKKAALDGERRYAHLNCPVLAIFALPHDQGLPPGPKRDAVDASDLQTFGPVVDSFEAGVPSARVVRIPHAQHAVYDSNPDEVMREINRFVDSLK